MKNSGLVQGERFFQEIRTTTFRKEEFEYVHTGIIDEAGDTWKTTELDEANIFQVYNQYRVKHGIPFPDEIHGLRKHYGLSAAKMSQILGFGYRSMSIEKVTATVHRLLSTLGSTFVTKMNKLLFYVDFISYKRCGYGITGLTYHLIKTHSR